ncbi:MAG TPA: hypothetical protein VGL42_00120 [Opitutaceae bacterium]|jgi:hypothetical protein
MKHAIRVVLFGTAVAFASHMGWYRLHQVSEAAHGSDQLAWMKTELRLTDTQYARIASLYRESSPRLQQLSTEVARLREAYAAFETTRVSTDQVDFLAFADFMRRQREVDRDCSSTLHELVAATGGVLNPDQRARYAQLVGPTLAAHRLAAE